MDHIHDECDIGNDCQDRQDDSEVTLVEFEFIHLKVNGIHPTPYGVDVHTKMVVLAGLEPATYALSRRCSSQLSYKTVK